MRAVVTRVKSASVEIDGSIYSSIGNGLLVLLGVHQEDTEAEALKIADKLCGIRIFEDENGKMNLNPADAGAELLIISQFTLFAECKSRRPGFSKAARPDTAIPLYELVIAKCRARMHCPDLLPARNLFPYLRRCSQRPLPAGRNMYPYTDSTLRCSLPLL